MVSVRQCIGRTGEKIALVVVRRKGIFDDFDGLDFVVGAADGEEGCGGSSFVEKTVSVGLVANIFLYKGSFDFFRCQLVFVVR